MHLRKSLPTSAGAVISIIGDETYVFFISYDSGSFSIVGIA